MLDANQYCRAVSVSLPSSRPELLVSNGAEIHTRHRSAGYGGGILRGDGPAYLSRTVKARTVVTVIG